MADKKGLEVKVIVSSEEISSSSFDSDSDSFAWDLISLDDPKQKLKLKARRIKSKGRKERKGKKLFRIIASEVFMKRLPEKSDIVRCRGVCKRWRSYLSTPQFILIQRQNHPVTITIDDYKVFLLDVQGRTKSFPFRTLSLNQAIPPFPDSQSDPNLDPAHDPDPNANPIPASLPPVSIIGSLDGLVCVAVSRSWRRNTALVFLNPLTGAFKSLPPIHMLSATDPIGFYCDSCNNDYKVVCLVADGLEGALVYSRRLDSWKEIEFSVLPNSYLWLSCWSPPIFCGQSLYFQVKDFRSFSRIICFDVKTETFREIKVPNPPPDDYSPSLVVLNGCLHLYVPYDVTDVMCIVEVYRMKNDDGDEWVPVSIVKVEGQMHQKQFICTETIGDWLAVLDQGEKSFKKMTTEEFKTHYPRFTSAAIQYRHGRVLYVHSLLSL